MLNHVKYELKNTLCSCVDLVSCLSVLLCLPLLLFPFPFERSLQKKFYLLLWTSSMAWHCWQCYTWWWFVLVYSNVQLVVISALFHLIWFFIIYYLWTQISCDRFKCLMVCVMWQSKSKVVFCFLSLWFTGF